MTAPRALVVVSSATEARALSPVAVALSARRFAVSVLDTGPIGVGNAPDGLPDELPRERLGLQSRLAPGTILGRHAPAVVLLGNDNLYLNRQLVRTAEAHGIPTVLVQEGATSSSRLESIARGPLSALLDVQRSLFHVRSHVANGDVRGLTRRVRAVATRRPLDSPAYGFAGARVFCVANHEVAQAFEELGCPSRIVVTGVPNLVAAPNGAAAAAPPYDIVYIAAPLSGAGILSEDRYRDYLRRVFTALRHALPESKLAVKVHPSWERIKTYDWLASACPGVVVLDERDRAASMKLGSAYLSFGSTLMLDVWMAQRVGVCLADAEVPEALLTTDVYRLARAHGATVALLTDDPEVLRRKLVQPSPGLFEAVLREYGLCVGTGAAGRIADVVEELERSRTRI